MKRDLKSYIEVWKTCRLQRSLRAVLYFLQSDSLDQLFSRNQSKFKHQVYLLPRIPWIPSSNWLISRAWLWINQVLYNFQLWFDEFSQGPSHPKLNVWVVHCQLPLIALDLEFKTIIEWWETSCHWLSVFFLSSLISLWCLSKLNKEDENLQIWQFLARDTQMPKALWLSKHSQSVNWAVWRESCLSV